MARWTVLGLLLNLWALLFGMTALYFAGGTFSNALELERIVSE